MPAALTARATPAIELYWRAYQVLDRQRGSGGSGPNPLKYQAIQSYAQDHGLILDDAVTVLQMMDDEYFTVHGERMETMRVQAEKARRAR